MKSLGSWSFGLAVLSATVFVLTGTGGDLAHVKADDAKPPANASSITQQTVAQFSAMQLKDPTARWILTIAVANDITTVKPGDIIDFLVLTPDERADDPPEDGRVLGGPYAQFPSHEQILRSLPTANFPFAVDVTREDVSIDIERASEHLGEPKMFPMVGMAQLHVQTFKCTVHSQKTTRSDWPVPIDRVEQASEIVHIDSNRLLAVVRGTPVADKVQVVGVTNDRTGRQNGDRLIVAVTPRQAIRLKSAKSSGTVFIQLHRP